MEVEEGAKKEEAKEEPTVKEEPTTETPTEPAAPMTEDPEPKAEVKNDEPEAVKTEPEANTVQEKPPTKPEETPQESDGQASPDESKASKDADSSQEEDEEEEEEEDPADKQVAISDIRGCRSVENFQKLNMISEGSYGKVFRAQAYTPSGKPGRIYALKQVKMEKEKEGFPLTALREINLLMTLKHRNIVTVDEVVVGASMDSIFVVMEYVEHDVKFLQENMKARFSQAEVKCLLQQLLSACKFMHANWVIHRDLKTSNLLYNNRGELKVCDFGLARLYGDPIKKMTPGVVTLWYRSPEILLGEEFYTPAVDLWSVGCVFAEFLQKEPLWPGKNEGDMITRIFADLGTPTEESWPQYNSLPNAKKFKFTPCKGKLRDKFPKVALTADKPSLTENGFDLLTGLLALDPCKRLTADAALKHPFFTDSPPPKEPSMMPTFRPTNEQTRKKRRKN
eukprot:TRINITY_DN61462_c0_g3_i1.p2 TRINITY_DN61462_c0_g3~~TRINITY_DN61462_c0_g3_i1.p2  ORF type:complete len:452 (+),score=79.91 TRINITY_DN61462_c0_g3_i1:19-1374(+)